MERGGKSSLLTYSFEETLDPFMYSGMTALTTECYLAGLRLYYGYSPLFIDIQGKTP